MAHVKRAIENAQKFWVLHVNDRSNLHVNDRSYLHVELRIFVHFLT